MSLHLWGDKNKISIFTDKCAPLKSYQNQLKKKIYQEREQNDNNNENDSDGGQGQQISGLLITSTHETFKVEWQKQKWQLVKKNSDEMIFMITKITSLLLVLNAKMSCK